MQCPRCHNTNLQHLYKVNGQYYCRECISFHRVYVKQERFTKKIQYPLIYHHYQLDFELSRQQKKISQKLVENYQQKKNSLVLAVCGSGKTEIVYEVICYALSQGQRVCFCIPRKELVKELYERICQSFSHTVIGVLYGGYQQNLDAQFIICTMHQLYKFENDIGFDLMIADEVDAFPFYQNRVLNEIFTRCCLGNYIKLSATFASEDIQGEELLFMNRRYHGYDLPVPQMILSPSFLQKLILVLLILFMHKKIIVYVPTVAIVYQLVHTLRPIVDIEGVSSHHPHNQKTIQELKEGKIQVIVSTTLLERGMTVEDVQVIVYHGEHVLFDERTLIQIAGRVGRKPDFPTGKVYILTSERTKGITQCIKTIRRLNQMNV